ncbi:MAG: bifunctional metallophosphatase/5'-nucleotidase [Flavobacteriaceae bacterium]|nr:bifunctional metallophosphatase/5'-nucleotidase [Flavobacteriaceae bacterium]
MKNIRSIIVIIFTTVFIFSCQKEDKIIKFTFLQLNDVYEIGALEGGEVGGMDRVETLHKQLLKENQNTFLFMAGDFLNPSLVGNIKLDGERIKGKQMIEVMNAMNFDLVTFGNHEFDLSDKLLQDRLNSSNFKWVATNIKHKTKDGVEPFYIEKNGIKKNIPRNVIFNIKNKDGIDFKIGFFSATLNANPVEYVVYNDFYEEAKNELSSLKNKVDIVFGLTHVKISQDKMLANMLPEVPLFMGGHEHFNMIVPVGNAVITKADANAKTVYVHRFEYNKTTKELIRKSELVSITPKIEADEKVQKIIAKWQVIMDQKIAEFAKNAHDVIYHAKTPLNGEDKAVRSSQTNLGEIITKAMSYAYGDKVDGVLINGGSMRLDDFLSGAITGVDIFRVLPFGGSIIKVEIKGDLLEKVLNYGRIKKGEGAYLQRLNFTYDKATKQWSNKGNKIKNKKIYTVVFSDYLLKGYDIPFLKPENKGVIKIHHPKEDELTHDIRKVIISYLKSLKD